MKDYEKEIIKRGSTYQMLKRFNETLNEETLLEMADTMNGIQQRLDSTWTTIVEHLLKVFVYKNQITDGELAFWYKEIRGKLFSLPKLKGKSSNNGRLEAERIFDRSFNVWEDNLEESIPRRLKELRREYPNLNTPDSLNIQEFNKFYDIVRDYYTWLSQQLSLKDEISVNDAEQKLKELFR